MLAGPGVHDDFVAALTEQAKATPGPACPTTRTSSTAPLNNADQLARVTGMVDRLPDHADLEAGGRTRRAASGYFYEPTVLSGLQAGRRADPERDLRPGHHRAALHRRGRGAALGQRRASTAWPPACGPRTTAARCGCARGLDFGVVWINTHIPFVSEMPHGGFKHSGYGKDLSMYGLEDYTRIKHVMSYIGE